jgi:hypothetical protein
MEIPEVNEKTAGLADGKNDVPAMNRINEEGGATEEAAIPKSYRNNAAAGAFTAVPLEYKAGGEKRLSAQANAEPHSFRNHWQYIRRWIPRAQVN